MVSKLIRQPKEHLPFKQALKLFFSGIIAFIADTLGVGSYAVNIALAKIFGTFRDDEMPFVNTGAQVIPGVLESFFFMSLIDVDLTTLLTLIAGTSIGGLLGGFFIIQLNRQAIRLTMMYSFALIIFLLMAHQFHLLPLDGALIELHSWNLVLGFLAMVAGGALASAGVGLFVMVQGVLFLMNISPALAFPIMTTASAMQQPLTTIVFLQQNKIPLKKTLILSLSGCIGVLIAIPIFMQLTIAWLHSLLLFILTYNFFTVGRNYWRSRSLKTSIHAASAISPVAAE